jgi:hypothetical protein
MDSITMKLPVRISGLDWERSLSERAKIRAVLKNTLGDLSQDERKAIRKPIEGLLKGGEQELEEVHGAGHATANGMMQQVSGYNSSGRIGQARTSRYWVGQGF